jgi:hypothetical protein
VTTWFRSAGYGARIDAVEVSRHTDNSVWLGETRRARHSVYDCFWPTWEEAHAHLMRQADAELAVARLRLQNVQARHGNVKGLKKPDNT